MPFAPWRDRVAPAAPGPPLTAESTIGDWLEHPRGRTVLSEALDGADEDTLAQAIGLTLDQLVMYSQGALPADLPATLLARVDRF